MDQSGSSSSARPSSGAGISDAPRRARKPAPAPSIDPAALEAAALAYIGRFEASREGVRRVLERRLYRAARAGVAPERLEAARATLAALLDRLTQRGFVDDTRFAAMKAGGLRRRGLGRQAVLAKLQQAGIAGEDAALALAAEDAERAGSSAAAEQAAAWALAKRRRLGPFRPADMRAAHRLKDLGVMARAGFGRGVAQAVIDAAPEAVPL